MHIMVKKTLLRSYPSIALRIPAAQGQGQGQLYLGRVAQSALGWYQKGPCVN